MAQRLSIIITFILIGLKLFSQTSQNDFSFKSPDSIGKLKSVKLWSTQYFIHKFDSKGNIPIIDQDGNPMNLYADTCNFCEAALEGTAYVTDSLGVVTIINFAKTGKKALVNCRLCKKYFKSKLEVESWGKTLWKKTTGFGDGVKNYKLIPFRTIAVDTKVIPYGTVLFIPQLKGKTIKLPNGVTVIHDGYLFAGDTGGAIKKNHIDTFTGILSANPFPEVIKSNEKKTFDAYIVNDPQIIKSLTRTQTK